MTCGCRKGVRLGEPEVFYCALHKAAPELLAVVQGISTALSAAYLAAKGNLSNADRYEAMRLVEEAGKSARAAIAKAEGRATSNDKGTCSVCRRPQPNGWHEHACE